jgi:hypothetical protein
MGPFWNDRRGSVIEKLAVLAAAISLGALFVGRAAQDLAENGGLPTFAMLSPGQYVANKSTSNFTSIDYAATGSINKRIVLDPCTGQEKSP